MAVFNTMLHMEISRALRSLVVALEASPAFTEFLKDVQGEQAESIGLLHWINTPDGFSALRSFMAAQRATENLDFVFDAMNFKSVEDIASTKDVALRIHAKFIEDGALAQVCLPPQVLEERKRCGGG